MIMATKETGKNASTKPREPVSEDFFKNLSGRVEAMSQEDPFQAALRIERHYETEIGRKFVHHYGRPNPWMGRLTNEDAERIVKIINDERTP